jgi:hypothetical protein
VIEQANTGEKGKLDVSPGSVSCAACDREAIVAQNRLGRIGVLCETYRATEKQKENKYDK